MVRRSTAQEQWYTHQPKFQRALRGRRDHRAEGVREQAGQIERLGRRKLHTYELLFELVRDRRLDLAGLLTHTFRPDQYREAFHTLGSRNRQPVIKAAFDFRQG